MSDPSPEWLDLTDAQLRDRVIADGETQSKLTIGPAQALLRTMWEVMALTVQRAFQIAVRPIARHADPRRATGLYLRLHGINAATPFRAARATRGHVRVTSAAGGRMPAGTEIEAGGQAFTTDNELRLTAGVAGMVAMTASVAGSAGNVAPGADVSFSGTPTPDDAVAELPAQWITRYGHEADDDDDAYRERVLAGFEVRGEANTLARYRAVVLGVTGVSSVAAGRAPRGYGSADISCLFAGELPTAAQLETVRAAIADAALGGRDVRVAAPRVVSIAVVVSITGSATVTAVEDAIGAWWRANIGIGDGLLVQSLYESAHAGAVGIDTIDSIVYSSPAANLPALTNTWYQPVITVTVA